jgi:hypothetical protein
MYCLTKNTTSRWGFRHTAERIVNANVLVQRHKFEDMASLETLLGGMFVWVRPFTTKVRRQSGKARPPRQGPIQVCRPRRFRVLWRTCVPGCVLPNGPGPPGRHSAAGLEQPQQMFGLAARVCARLGLGTTCRTQFCGERRANTSIGTLNCFWFPRTHCPSSIGNGPAMAIRGPKALRKQLPVPGMSRSVGHLHFPEVQVSKNMKEPNPSIETPPAPSWGRHVSANCLFI